MPFRKNRKGNLFYEWHHIILLITYIRKSTHRMKQLSAFCILLFTFCSIKAQTPKTYTSSEILLQIKKLNVLGSVLYIAAHPDDENTRLLAYLANEKMYRTGYLSLTRGDGGQNLIGDEQGIDLGLIRTQELLAARRIDGAEQFFSRAYDFGFCKSPEEALATWGHDKILSDVVWVIRKFKPDVIIARFPEDSRAGHGHHAASGILAREAFDAAADPAKFPEQLKEGVTVWQAKRMLWNTYNFGGNSTQNESQFKVDVGMYNPLVGKSYGEIAALSRSQHKSQGFGVPAQRGTVVEYFETIRGDKPVNDLFDGVDAGWSRINQKNIEDSINLIISRYDMQSPVSSLRGLVSLYNTVDKLEDGYWKAQKLIALKHLIENCSGLFMEATTGSQFTALDDSLKINIVVNNRLGINIPWVNVNIDDGEITLKGITKNTNVTHTDTLSLSSMRYKITQPYWLENPMDKGSFNVSQQVFIGMAENDPFSVQFDVSIEGTEFTFHKPVQYKYTDPVKGELYQPVYIIPSFYVSDYSKVVVRKELKDGDYSIAPSYSFKTSKYISHTEVSAYFEPQHQLFNIPLFNSLIESNLTRKTEAVNYPSPSSHLSFGNEVLQKNTIQYDHIPTINYFSKVDTKIVEFTDGLKIEGSKIGYIPGAGDKVPQALEQMGYKVTILREPDITEENLKQFDAVVTGVRAYNTNEWMGNVYETLMEYVKEGGVLLTQYNTNNFISSIKSKVGPYPFGISRTRVTDETAKVNFLLPNHPALNYPNKITERDFENWIQERSVYHAEKIDSNYQRIFSMSDTGEKADDGSLVVANYGKGKFVYTGLVFFRQLPAGVPGAYRLFANLLAKNEVARIGNTWQLPPTKPSPQKKAGKKNGKLHN